MSRRLHQAVNRWLRAERDAQAASDRPLRRVFEALPAAPLPAGFADRVMLGAGLAAPRHVAPMGWRVALGAALTLAAAATATVPSIALGLWSRVSTGDVLRFAAGTLVETCQRLAEGLVVWQTVGSIGETFAAVLSSPPILTALLAATLISAGGLRMLHGLLAVDRRHENVRA